MDNARVLVADPSATVYYHCDGNGSVTCLINAFQQVVAKYLYDPFGNTLSMYGSAAEANSYRFSSKEWNGNSGLYYYLYRFYDPSLQRWINRDPIEEKACRNLFKFCMNNPVLFIDSRGLKIGIDNNLTLDQINHLRNCICELMNSPNGKALLLQAAQPNLDIEIHGGDEASTGAGPNGQPIIYWNPNDPIGLSSGQRNDPDNCPGEIPPNSDAGCAAVLAHELGHALHPHDPTGKDEPDGTNVHDHENPVRIDLGLPRRPCHHGDPVAK